MCTRFGWLLAIHFLFSVIVTELAAPKQPGPQAFDSVSAARTHICPKFLRREATTARAHELSKEQLIVAACVGARRKTTRARHRCGLRTHGCARIAAAALQLARALQK